MDYKAAHKLAGEIRAYPIFDPVRVLSNLDGTYSVRFIITYSRSVHFVHDRDDFAWVKRNLSDPRGIEVVAEHEARSR